MRSTSLPGRSGCATVLAIVVAGRVGFFQLHGSRFHLIGQHAQRIRDRRSRGAGNPTQSAGACSQKFGELWAAFGVKHHRQYCAGISLKHPSLEHELEFNNGSRQSRSRDCAFSSPRHRVGEIAPELPSETSDAGLAGFAPRPKPSQRRRSEKSLPGWISSLAQSAGDRGRGSICTVAVIPATRRTPSGTSSMRMRTGMR